MSEKQCATKRWVVFAYGRWRLFLISAMAYVEESKGTMMRSCSLGAQRRLLLSTIEDGTFRSQMGGLVLSHPGVVVAAARSPSPSCGARQVRGSPSSAPYTSCRSTRNRQ